MSQELYYIPPEDEIFHQMQKIACDIWSSYDDTYWYASEKMDKVKSIWNIWDNFMYIFAMFDFNNQSILLKNADIRIVEEIKKRLPDDYRL